MWADKRVLMTGGTGFVGTNLLHRLAQQASQVWVYARDGARLSGPGLEGRVRMVRGDIQDHGALRRAVECSRPDVIFHLASSSFNPPPADPLAHLRVIVLGTRNLLAAVPDGARVRIVSTGSGAEYGDGAALTEDLPPRPATELGVAKAAATLLLQAAARRHTHDTVVLRLFTPYGPWERASRLIPHVIVSCLENREVRITNGGQSRDFVYVDDVVDAFLRAADTPAATGGVFNVCSGRSTSIRAVCEMLMDLMARPARLVCGALPTRPDEIWECSGSNAAALRALGWRPQTSLLDGLTRSIAWWRAAHALV